MGINYTTGRNFMSLEVKNLVKKYGEKTVVNHLSFQMEQPGVYALLGTNGAGKTTTNYAWNAVI